MLLINVTMQAQSQPASSNVPFLKKKGLLHFFMNWRDLHLVMVKDSNLILNTAKFLVLWGALQISPILYGKYGSSQNAIVESAEYKTIFRSHPVLYESDRMHSVEVRGRPCSNETYTVFCSSSNNNLYLSNWTISSFSHLWGSPG